MNFMYVCGIMAVMILTGCIHGNGGNKGQLESYPAPVVEAAWIRNGEPIVFEGKQWFPVKDIENLRDIEVFQIGEYKGVQIFVDKVDFKPYARIYTKFARGKFRYFERARND
jgi:hypothetical protein